MSQSCPYSAIWLLAGVTVMMCTAHCCLLLLICQIFSKNHKQKHTCRFRQVLHSICFFECQCLPNPSLMRDLIEPLFQCPYLRFQFLRSLPLFSRIHIQDEPCKPFLIFSGREFKPCPQLFCSCFCAGNLTFRSAVKFKVPLMFQRLRVVRDDLAHIIGDARKTPADVSRPWDVSAAAQAAKICGQYAHPGCG